MNNEIHADFGKIGEPFVRDSLYTRSPSSSLKGSTSTERFAEAIARLAYPGHLDTKHMQAAVSGSAPAGAARRERDGLNRTEAACIDVSAGAVSISKPSSRTAVASRSMKEGGHAATDLYPQRAAANHTVLNRRDRDTSLCLGLSAPGVVRLSRLVQVPQKVR